MKKTLRTTGLTCMQERIEARCRPGQETSLAPPPMFAPEFFRKQMYHIEDHL